MKLRNSRYTFLPALAVITLSVPSVFAATGIFAGTGGDPYWDADASNWTGVTGNAWDATFGPTNVAQFNSVNSNPTTSGAVVANGLIWNNTGGGIAGGTVKLDGASPFIDVNTSGTTSQFYANLTGINGFTKIGAGQFFLMDSVKSITGGVTINQGLIRLDLAKDALTAAGVLNSSNSLTMSGSTLEVQGRTTGASTQSLSTFTLNAGGSRINFNPNGGTGTTLSLANWTRTGNGSSLFIDFAPPSAGSGTRTLTLTGTLPTLSNGIIGGYATIRDSATTFGFATLDGSNNVVRYTGATAVSSNLGANTVSNTNYRATSAGNWFNGTGTAQSLNSLDIAVDGSVGGNTAATYTLGSGGLLFSLNSTFATPTANLKMTSSTSEFQLSSLSGNNGYASAAIGSSGGIYDNGAGAVSLVKSGPGGLRMGSGTFSYTGDTIVNQGSLDNIANIPSGTGKGNLVVNALGTVTLGVDSSGGTRTINGLANTSLGGGNVNNVGLAGGSAGPASAVFLNLGNNNASASFSGVITGTSIIKNGTGTQTFAGANTYTGSTTVNAGTLKITNASGLGASGALNLMRVNSPAGVSVTPLGSGITSAALDLNGAITTSYAPTISLNGTATGGNTASLINSAAGTTATLTAGTGLNGVAFTSSNSGLSAANITLTFTGGGGTGAAGAVRLANTASSFTATGGTGWLTGNRLTVGGGGSTTSAVYTVTATLGAITGLTLTTPGIGFTSLSGLTFTGSNGTQGSFGTGATTGSVDGTFVVNNIQLTNAGSGYTSAPTLGTSVGIGLVGSTITPGVTLTGTQNQMGGDGNLTVNSVVSGASAGFTKIGNGTLSLTGANTYTGATTIKAGTLKVNTSTSISASNSIIVGDAGSTTAVLDVSSGGFTVGSTQTLSGIGKVFADAADIVTVSGTISAGNSGVGTLTFDGGLLTLNNLSKFTYGLGTSSDLVTLMNGATLALGSSIGFNDFTFTDSGGFGAGTYMLIGGASSFTGSLDAGDLTGTVGGLGSTLSMSGNNLVLTVIPEPNVAALLGGLGTLALLRRRRVA